MLAPLLLVVSLRWCVSLFSGQSPNMISLAGGLSALNKLLETCQQDGTRIIIADLQYQPLRALARAGVKPVEGVSRFTPTLADALAQAGDHGNSSAKQ